MLKGKQGDPCGWSPERESVDGIQYERIGAGSRADPAGDSEPLILESILEEIGKHRKVQSSRVTRFNSHCKRTTLAG